MAADWERAKRLYPSTDFTVAEWVTIFDANPDLMWQIVGDIYDVVKAEEEKERGLRRMGRRPRRVGSLADVWATVFPAAYTTEAFGPALADLLAQRKMSQRAFAMKIPVHQTTMSRFISGALEPDMRMMERIAEAAKVQPAFFAEYRAKLIGDAVSTVLLQRPNMGITAYRYLKHGATALQEADDD